MLTAAFGASPETAQAAYDLPELSRLLDHIHIMAYDYHGSWDKYASHNAPLFAPPGKLSVASSVDYFISQGADAHKLVLGLPLYGRTFLLNNMSEPGSAFEKPTDGKGFQGPFTREDGILGYNEVIVQFCLTFRLCVSIIFRALLIRTDISRFALNLQQIVAIGQHIGSPQPKFHL